MSTKLNEIGIKQAEIDANESAEVTQTRVNDENVPETSTDIDLKQAEFHANEIAKNMYRTYEIITCLQKIIIFVQENQAIAHSNEQSLKDRVHKIAKEIANVYLILNHKKALIS